MVDVKMTSILVTTSHFLATLDFPVKNKIAQSISKKVTALQESIDAVVTVSPIVHHGNGHNEEHLAADFYDVICEEAGEFFTKKRQKELQDFLKSCGDKIRHELKDCIDNIHIEQLQGKADNVFINLLDKSGNLVHTTKRSVRDLTIAFKHMSLRLLLWKEPRKRGSLFIKHEEELPKKPRRKEKVLRGEKEGGMRRYHPGMSLKIA